ncbi:tyrosine-protein phosphatase [Sphingorhabdus pulchriflava]|nr:tyrosine-protein phosphatase [Sphingorhabdus pulchriflava]
MNMASDPVIERVIQLDAVHNFRDYGGYQTGGGSRLRSGILYRSAQHKEATPDDLERISALKLSTIVDLRGASERQQHPCARPADFTAEVLFSDGETVTQMAAPHIEAARHVETAEDAMQAMLSGYRDMPFRPVLVESLRLYFEALATRNGPSLVHCLAGKDRTGIAVAMLHNLLGVHADDIMADYLLTNVAGNIEARIAAGATVVRNNFGPQISDEAVRTLMTAHPSWLEAMFAEVNERHGSLRNYTEHMLGVTPELLSRIEQQLLV